MGGAHRSKKSRQQLSYIIVKCCCNKETSELPLEKQLEILETKIKEIKVKIFDKTVRDSKMI